MKSKSKTILLVEDEVIIAKNQTMELEKRGYEVIHAVSGEDAVIIISENTRHIDLILMDIDLGSGIDGTEATEIILNHQDLPVVFLSSHSESEIVEKTEKITSYGYVVKNSGITVLDASIKMAFKLFNSKIKEKNYISFLDKIMDQSPLAMWISDVKGNIVRTNNSLHSILKVPDEELFKKYNVFKDKNIEDQGLMPLVKDVFQKQIPCKFSFFWSGKNNGDETFENSGQLWMDVSMYPVVDHDNKLVNVVCQWIDTTKQKMMEDSLKESEEKYRSIFENSQDAILIIENLKFIDCNQATIDMLNYESKDQFLNVHPSVLSPDFQPDGKSSLQKANEMMEIALKEGSHRFEWIHKRSGDELFPVEVTLTAIFSEDDKQIIHTVWRDITERKKNESDIIEQTKFIDTIIESSAISMWISDDKGTAIRANSACLKFFGAAEEEVIGKYNLFYDSVIEEKGFMPDIKSVFEKGEVANVVIDYDFGSVDHVDIKNPKHKIINSIFTPLLDHSGKVSNVIVQSIDISDIINAKEELKIALEQNEEFYRELQHRVKNSFALISSMVRLTADSSESPEVKDAFRDIDMRILAVSEMYNMLYSHNSVNNVQFNEYLEKIINLIPLLSDHIEIIGIYEEVMLSVKTAIPIGLIVTELITNSIKHAFPENRNGTITVKLKTDKNLIVIEIYDDGIGVNQDVDFTKIDSLGLRIVDALVRQIHGSLTIVPDNGTSCTLVLPSEVKTS